MRRKLSGVALAALLASPAAAYLLPSTAVLKKMAQRREELALASLEVRGTLAAGGETARALAAAVGVAPPAAELVVPAVLSIKAPGRCRLEVFPPGAPGERPFVATGRGRLSGARGLDRVPAALALVRGACAFLGFRPGGTDPGRVYADEFARLGIALGEDYLGQMGGRVSYVIGAPPQEKRPQAWIDKQSFQPARLLASFSGPLADVRFVDFGSPVGGELFPRALEVHEGGSLSLRLTAEAVAPNPRLPDTLFP
ncbi:MAG TPA: hypothetical protein VMT17_10145 [Anaeromyxobacteraceae bacterium]|nr:hypothetical protein [Anaeromyxobacteraceae bacterium]